MEDTLANVGVEIEVDGKTALLLIVVLCSPVIIYFVFNILTK